MLNIDPQLTLYATLNKIDGAYSPSTIRAYRADFESFIQFCHKNNFMALPATPESVAKFVEHLRERQFKSSSIRRAIAGVATIRRMELVAGVPSSNAQNLDRVQRTFEEFGIEFIGDPDDCPGVRNLRIRRGIKN